MSVFHYLQPSPISISSFPIYIFPLPYVYQFLWHPVPLCVATCKMTRLSWCCSKWATAMIVSTPGHTRSCIFLKIPKGYAMRRMGDSQIGGWALEEMLVVAFGKWWCVGAYLLFSKHGFAICLMLQRGVLWDIHWRHCGQYSQYWWGRVVVHLGRFVSISRPMTDFSPSRIGRTRHRILSSRLACAAADVLWFWFGMMWRW